MPINEEHDLQLTVTKEATCAEEGEGTNTCTRCGHTEAVTLDKLKHTYKEGMILYATCHQKGSRQEYCTKCGKEQWYDIPIDPYAHHWITMGFMGTFCGWCGMQKDDL